MSIQIPDEKSAALLAAATVMQDVRGPDGRILGRFIPDAMPGMTYPEVGMTDEELMRPLTDPNTVWRTPEEVMARLREIDRCSN